MSLPLGFLRAARREFDEAADWYDDQRTGQGAKFAAAVREVLDRIANQPEFYAEVFDDVREGLVSNYPYAVYYRVESGQVVVLSVFHALRDPTIWQGRA